MTTVSSASAFLSVGIDPECARRDSLSPPKLSAYLTKSGFFEADVAGTAEVTQLVPGMSPYSASFQINTTNGVFIRSAVSISCEFIMKPASPVTATILRSGYASLAAIAPGTAIPSRRSRWR